MRFIFTLSAILILAAFFAVSSFLPASISRASDERTSGNDSSVSASIEGQRKFNKHVADDDEAKRITLEDAKKAFDTGEAVFVDTRSADSYNVEHIKGAVNIPVGEFEKRYKELPEDKTIIAYCS